MRQVHLWRLATAMGLLAAATAHADAPPWKEPAPEPTGVPWATPRVQLQTWFTAWDQDENPQADPGGYGDPEHDIGFSVPRARLGFAGGWRWIDFSLLVGTSVPYDAVSSGVTGVDLIDGMVRASFDSQAGTTRVALGQHSVPFSREMMMSSNDLVFQERAVSTNWLAPNRDLGLSLSHQWRWLRLAAGVFNGANGGGNLLRGDVDDGVQFATRLDVMIGGDTFRTNSAHNAFGLGAAYIHNTTPALTEQRINVDLLGRIAGVTLQVEGGMNILDPDDEDVILPPDVPEKTTRWGGFAQLSYYRELPVGAIEPAVRFAYYDDARHLQDNGDVGILHGGLTWREPIPFVDLGAGYIHRMELQGRSVQNDSVRVWVGLKYPSRKFAPVDLMALFDRLGKGKDPADAGKRGGRGKKNAP